MTRIAAGLERAFARNGFSEPSVGDLRDAAGVSLRTLYKYTPSREEMVHAALQHRHGRYLEKVFADLPADPDRALTEIFERVGDWMRSETTRGCLFHAAVASAPQDTRLITLLQEHKAEVARLAVEATGLRGKDVELTLLLEGLMQTWPLCGAKAVEAAVRLGQALRQEAQVSSSAA